MFNPEAGKPVPLKQNNMEKVKKAFLDGRKKSGYLMQGKKAAVIFGETETVIGHYVSDWDDGTRPANKRGFLQFTRLGGAMTQEDASAAVGAKIDGGRIIWEGSEEYSRIAAEKVSGAAPAVAPAVAPVEEAPAPAAVDPESPESLIAKAVALLAAQQKPAAPAAPAVEVKRVDGSTVKIEGVVHPLFKKCLAMMNNGIMPFVYGPAGTGKGTMARQLAEALGVPCYVQGKVFQPYELTGFVDAGGKLVETDFYRAWTQGGVFLQDEMDACPGDVLEVLNDALESRIMSWPGVGQVKAVDNFYFIGAGNTCGNGSAGGFVRNPLDPAYSNRFSCWLMDYAPEIDRAACNGNEELLRFCLAARKVSGAKQLGVLCTPRNEKRIVTLEALEMNLTEVLQAELIKDSGADVLRMLVDGVSLELAGGENKYLEALCECKPIVY
jgi:hypothetical protein